MRRPDNTIVFGSSSDGQSIAPPPPSDRMHTVGDDLVMPDRHGFVTRSDRGLAFAAISLALLGIAGAGTYFLLGIESTAHKDTPVSTTEITGAEVQPAESPAPAPAATVPAAKVSDLPWDPPEVDAVKAPGMAKKIEGNQVMPAERPEPVTPAPTARPRAPSKNVMVAPPPAPSPATSPTTEFVEPLKVPPLDDRTPAPDPLPDMQIKR